MKGRRIAMSLGATTIMITFVLICMTTFAALSAISASSDYELARKQVAATQAYYRADADIEEQLARLYETAWAVLPEAPDAEHFFASLAHLYTGVTHTAPGTAQLTLRAEAGEGRMLEADYQIRYTEDAGVALTCTRHQVVITADLTPEETPLNLWGGM